MVGLGLGILHLSFESVGFLATAGFYRNTDNLWSILRPFWETSPEVLFAMKQHGIYDGDFSLSDTNWATLVSYIWFFIFKHYWEDIFLSSDYKKSF